MNRRREPEVIQVTVSEPGRDDLAARRRKKGRVQLMRHGIMLPNDRVVMVLRNGEWVPEIEKRQPDD